MRITIHIRIEKSARRRVIIARLEIVQAGFIVIDIATVAEGGHQSNAVGIGDGYSIVILCGKELAPRAVLIVHGIGQPSVKQQPARLSGLYFRLYFFSTKLRKHNSFFSIVIRINIC